MLKSDAMDGDPGRANALAALNAALTREGFEAYYGDDDLLYVRHSAAASMKWVLAIQPLRIAPNR